MVNTQTNYKVKFGDTLKTLFSIIGGKENEMLNDSDLEKEIEKIEKEQDTNNINRLIKELESHEVVKKVKKVKKNVIEKVNTESKDMLNSEKQKENDDEKMREI